MSKWACFPNVTLPVIWKLPFLGLRKVLLLSQTKKEELEDRRVSTSQKTWFCFWELSNSTGIWEHPLCNERPREGPVCKWAEADGFSWGCFTCLPLFNTTPWLFWRKHFIFTMNTGESKRLQARGGRAWYVLLSQAGREWWETSRAFPLFCSQLQWGVTTYPAGLCIDWQADSFTGIEDVSVSRCHTILQAVIITLWLSHLLSHDLWATRDHSRSPPGPSISPTKHQKAQIKVASLKLERSHHLSPFKGTNWLMGSE